MAKACPRPTGYGMSKLSKPVGIRHVLSTTIFLIPGLSVQKYKKTKIPCSKISIFSFYDKTSNNYYHEKNLLRHP